MKVKSKARRWVGAALLGGMVLSAQASPVKSSGPADASSTGMSNAASASVLSGGSTSTGPSSSANSGSNGNGSSVPDGVSYSADAYGDLDATNDVVGLVSSDDLATPVLSSDFSVDAGASTPVPGGLTGTADSAISNPQGNPVPEPGSLALVAAALAALAAIRRKAVRRGA